MRTIKFRAWNGEMTYINDWHWYEANGVHDVEAGIAYGGYAIYNMMQFTGLTDKNGGEIYEGDIVRINGLTFEVTTNDFTKEWVIDGMTGQERLGMAYRKCKVIGNIYENPELIEEAANE